MNTVIGSTNRWAEAWLGIMAAVLWQSIVLVAVIAVVAWCLRRFSPVVRYWLWQIVAVKLLLMPFWTLAVPIPSWIPSTSPSTSVASPSDAAFHDDAGLPPPFPLPPAGAASSRAASPSGSLWELARSVTWQAWLLLLWSAVVLLEVFRLVAQRLRLARLLRGAVPAGEDIATLVTQLAGQLGLRRVPAAVSVAGDCPLFVCGFWTPRLVLPGQVLGALDQAERRQVILHELGHVKRHDLAWGWPIQLARMVYFFNPLVHWVSHQLRLERELACDQLAMAVGGHAPAEYARTLVQVVSHASRPAAVDAAAISAGLAGGDPLPKPNPQQNQS